MLKEGVKLMLADWRSWFRKSLNYRLLIIILITVIEAALGIGRFWPDSALWIKLSETLSKGFYMDSSKLQGILITYQMRPMLPLLAGLISPLFGYALSFGLINSLFWIGGAIIAYKLMKLIAFDENMAFSASLLFTTSIPMIAYGSSILSDPPEYFFVGLALYLVLLRKLKGIRRGMVFLDLTALGIGILFHPLILFALTFMAIVYLLDKKKRYESLLALSIIGFTYFSIAYAIGWIEQILYFIRRFLSNPLSPRGGPPFLDAFMWTFGIMAPLYPILIVPSHFIVYLINAVFFFAILALGSFRIHQKAEIFIYFLFLFYATHIQGINIERYLFVLWPCIIPILIYGLYYAFNNASKGLMKVLRREKENPYLNFILNPIFLVNLYIILQGFYNTYAIIQLLGLSSLLWFR
ncbi:MAG: hypothetical protein QXE19_04890 [Candidatus Bathyarchaeia archaeon]